MTKILPTLILCVLLLPTASRAQTPPGDPYLCYKAALAKTDPPQPKFATVQKTLEDQFGTLVQDVKGIQSVCNPPLAAARPDVHQVGYKLAPAKTTPPQPKFVKTNHTAYDQFGTHPLTVVKPAEVRAPSAKVLGAGGTGPVDTTGVDHFECYRVTPAKGAPKFVPPAPVAITDEFGTQNVTLTKITKLCTPVNKNGEDATAPQHVGHLVCYQAKLPKGAKFAAQTVSVNNTNFGAAVLGAKSVAEYCVPAFKDTVPTATATPTATTTPIATPVATATPTTCSAAQPCPGGVQCCAGTCLPDDAYCANKCSVTEYPTLLGFPGRPVGSPLYSCSGPADPCCFADADCRSPKCTNCSLDDPAQTCVEKVVPNRCGAGTCSTLDTCCGGLACCTSGQTCRSDGTCVDNCPAGSSPCGDTCCGPGTFCDGPTLTCKVACGISSCNPATQICCFSSCCDAATQVCGPSSGNPCVTAP